MWNDVELMFQCQCGEKMTLANGVKTKIGWKYNWGTNLEFANTKHVQIFWPWYVWNGLPFPFNSSLCNACKAAIIMHGFQKCLFIKCYSRFASHTF
jgi:hypothetical protein